MKKQDKDLTKAELQKAINTLIRMKGNQQIWGSFNKHMKGAIVYRIGKFERLLREKG
tara:strand:+ start:133 stop:303 length:171 start_codon:yes stop_codon:yes gene_type:complete